MKDQKEQSRQKIRSYLKYSTLASQMLVTIVVGVYLGNYIDNKYEGDGLYLALISVVFVIVAIYLGIKDLIHKNK